MAEEKVTVLPNTASEDYHNDTMSAEMAQRLKIDERLDVPKMRQLEIDISALDDKQLAKSIAELFYKTTIKTDPINRIVARKLTGRFDINQKARGTEMFKRFYSSKLNTKSTNPVLDVKTGEKKMINEHSGITHSELRNHSIAIVGVILTVILGLASFIYPTLQATTETNKAIQESVRSDISAGQARMESIAQDIKSNNDLLRKDVEIRLLQFEKESKK